MPALTKRQKEAIESELDLSLPDNITPDRRAAVKAQAEKRALHLLKKDAYWRESSVDILAQNCVSWAIHQLTP